ncbi:MAG: pantetheine-phosphate adenylyltransferase [Bdellovibrio sp.]|nr:MAG: pantetheine-phosphate adenylyltransferase [Bdellovibrio sp.]
MTTDPRRIAVYPGSFDPITLGHVDIINRVARLYDQVIVLIANAPEKPSLFSIQERKDLIRRSLNHVVNVEIVSHDGLTIDFLKQRNCHVLVRGLRAVVDFEYEISMSNINNKLAPEIETILIFARPEYYFLSSRSVKEVARYGGALDELVPLPVVKALQQRFQLDRKE